MSKEQKGRNIKIWKTVLNGASCNQMAKQYGVSKERVRQIVFMYCRKANSSFYEKRPKRNPLQWLRNNKDQFI